MHFFLTYALLISAPQVVFMHEDGKAKQIEIADIDGSHVRALTDTSVLSIYPHISADGEWISYAEGSDEKTLGIVMLNLKTGVSEEWVPAKGMNLHPDLSRSGEWLTFSGAAPNATHSQIGFIDLKAERKKGSASTQILQNSKIRNLYNPQIEWIDAGVPSYFPAVSSDGNFVVFQENLSPQSKQIVLYDRASTAPKFGDHIRVISDATQTKSMSPSLSFDDRFVAYTSLVNKNWDIYLVDLKAKNAAPVRVTSDAAQDFAPTFTPSGGLIFASDRTGTFQLYQISADSIADQTFQAKLFLQEAGNLYSASVTGDLAFEQKRLPDMMGPSRSSFGAIQNGDRIYVVGGHEGQGHKYPKESFLNRVEYYDLKTGDWHTAASRPSVGHGFGLASFGKYIYAFGGFTYSEDHDPKWKSLDVIERLDTEKDQWTLVGHMPRARSSNVVVRIGTKVYLIGGWDSTPRFPNDLAGVFHRAIDVFDLQTETISQSAFQLPDPLRRAFTGVAYGNSIILSGGIGEGGSHFSLVDQVTMLDTDTGTWTELPRLPFANFAPASEILGDKLFVFGGLEMTSQTSGAYQNHIFELDLKNANTAWKHSGRYLSEAKGFSQVLKTNDHTLLILGGHAPTATGDSPVLTVEELSELP